MCCCNEMPPPTTTRQSSRMLRGRMIVLPPSNMFELTPEGKDGLGHRWKCACPTCRREFLPAACTVAAAAAGAHSSKGKKRREERGGEKMSPSLLDPSSSPALICRPLPPSFSIGRSITRVRERINARSGGQPTMRGGEGEREGEGGGERERERERRYDKLEFAA